MTRYVICDGQTIDQTEVEALLQTLNAIANDGPQTLLCDWSLEVEQGKRQVLKFLTRSSVSRNETYRVINVLTDGNTKRYRVGAHYMMGIDPYKISGLLRNHGSELYYAAQALFNINLLERDELEAVGRVVTLVRTPLATDRDSVIRQQLVEMRQSGGSYESEPPG